MPESEMRRRIPIRHLHPAVLDALLGAVHVVEFQQARGLREGVEFGGPGGPGGEVGAVGGRGRVSEVVEGEGAGVHGEDGAHA